MRVGTIVGAVVVLLAYARTAEAGWSYSWECSGACAPDRLTISGSDGPYSDESSCESASRQRLDQLNGPGSAGYTSSCVDGDPGPARSGGAGAVRAARLARAYFALDGGRGYTATYADGRVEHGSSQVGGEAEAMFGREAFGLGVELGVRKDAGTAPMAGDSADPMWMVDIGFGLGSSPFAIVQQTRFEVRPDLGAYYIWAIRTGCNRCSVDPADITGRAEPSSGNTFRLRAGLDFYFGAGRSQGIAVDASYQLGKLGDLNAAGEPTSVELAPPKVLLRLSYLRRPR
ncbi:MAG TPA: hypothetical protein VGM90_20405 [Kofleriaceae bacterium]|jgi:hypothetical protein